MKIVDLIRLKKGEESRIRNGHPWIYSNEIDTSVSPLKSFSPGQEVRVESFDKHFMGKAYVNPHSLIAARILSRNENEELNQDFFSAQIRNALRLRENLFTQPYYRLVFSEADQLSGLIIDRFANDFVVQINTAGMEMKTEFILAALLEIFPDLSSILLRNDSSIRLQEGLETYIKPAYGQVPDTITLEENAIKFTAPLLSGQKTGWFYDHRMNRARFSHYAANKTVLDVFSYVGGWGIQAGLAGASQIDCIDASETAAAFIKKNAKLNNIEDKLTVICADAFEALKKLLADKKTYDLIVLDPPAFVKKFKDKKQGLIAYQRINELALKLLSPGGILFSCSCSMHISMEDMFDLLRRAAYRAQTTIQVIERGHQGPDHPLHICIPETDYLKAVVLRNLK